MEVDRISGSEYDGIEEDRRAENGGMVGHVTRLLKERQGQGERHRRRQRTAEGKGKAMRGQERQGSGKSEDPRGSLRNPTNW